MADARELELEGTEGALYAAVWPNPQARYVAIVAGNGTAEQL